MKVDLPTLGSRVVGSEFQRIRKRAGRTGQDMCTALGWEPSKISRTENGLRRLSVEEAAHYLGQAQATVDEFHELMSMVRLIEDGSFVKCHPPGFTEHVRALVVLEQDSNSFVAYEMTRIPDLLQAERYMRVELGTTGHLGGVKFETAVTHRLSRQRYLANNILPRSIFFIHEQALHAVRQSRELMHDQLLHLVMLASTSQCEIRIIPDISAAGFFPFNFRMYYEDIRRIAVTVETITATVILEGIGNLEAYSEALAVIKKSALDAEDSISKISEIASAYDKSQLTAETDSSNKNNSQQ